MKSIILIFALLAALAITACIQKQGEITEQSKTVTVMLYSEYITPEVLKDFQKKTGYKIKLEIYEAQEEMLAKLMTSDSSKYDVIIASDVVIQQMIHLRLIAPLNMSLIPNRINVAPQFRNQK